MRAGGGLTLGAPLLATITLAGQGDGIAVVAGLLHDAMRAGWGRECRAVTMFDGAARAPELSDKIRFAIQLGRQTLVARPTWMLANHLGLLKALGATPAPLRPPHAVFLHGIEAWRRLTPADHRWVAGARLRLANSGYTAKRTLASNPDIGPIETCPLALPDSRLPREPGPSAQVPELGPHAVLAVGRMSAAERYKGHDELLAAWPAIRARVADAQLVLAGGGDDVLRMKAAAADESFGGSVHVLGFVPDDDLELLYRRAAIFALPSSGEGFGLVYLEAMARGLPCVALRESAAADIVADGETGCLVPARQPDALAGVLTSLLRDRDRRAAMGASARARVAAEFSRTRFEQRAIAALAAAFGPAPASRR